MDDVKHILVVSRAIEDCCKAFHYGVSLARKYDAELSVLHVMHDPFSAEGWSLPIPDLGALEEEQQKMREDIKKELDKIIASEKTRGMTIKEFIKEGAPVDEVFKIVKEEKIDLMIMPAHEEGRLEHLLFSRDNEKLIREMPCSIFLSNTNCFDPGACYNVPGEEDRISSNTYREKKGGLPW
jgi:universal stress protein A